MMRMVTERQCYNWFAKFHSTNSDVEDATHSIRPVEDNEGEKRY